MRRMLLAVALASACTEPAPPVNKPVPATPRTTTLVVSLDGTELGTIVIVPGEVGTLAPSADPNAKHLVEEWAKVAQWKAVHVDMHLPGKHGERGPYGTRVIRPTDSDYTGWVQSYLRQSYLEYGRSYDVAVK